VTNQRSETIDFAVYKLWHDVARVAPYGGEAGKDKDFDPLMEAHRRPDIFLTLYQSIGGAAPVEVPQFVRRTWSTTHGPGGMDPYNEYYWKCTFDPLPRYTSTGVEIVYSVIEGMPNRPGSNYVTEYWELIVPEIVPNPWVRPVPEPVSPSLSHVTNVPIYEVPNKRDPNAHASADQFVLTNTVRREGEPGRVGNGGIIVNRREATRFMSGYKVWRNVPSDTPPAGFPTIVLSLMQRNDNNYPNIWQPVDLVRFPNVTLRNGNTTFSFGAGDVPMARFDEFGVYIRYRAEEIGETAPGYKDPEYNDYLMEVTNEYNVSHDAPAVTVAFTKTWDVSPNELPLHPDKHPEAIFELYREMTTNGTVAIPGTQVKVGQMSVPYNPGGYRHVFGDEHLINTTTRMPLFDLPFEEVEHGVKLLKYGYNGQKYNYFIKEIMPGYEVTITPAADPVADPNAADFYFTAHNVYDGFSDGRYNDYVLLNGRKYWDDHSDLYGYRPVTGTPGANNVITPDPNVVLLVYRSIAGVPGFFEEITSSVNITWFAVPGSPNVWRYEVHTKPVGSQTIPVGGEPGAFGAPSLYRYAAPGVEYVYYVEEVATGRTGAHAYDITREAGAGTRVTLTNLSNPSANPTELTGNLAVYPLNMRLRADAAGGNKVASFRNVLRDTALDITKVWVKDDGSAMTRDELELMLPDEITFEVEYRLDRVDGDNVDEVQPWTPMPDPHSTAYPRPAVSITRSRAAIINALGDSNSMRIVFSTNPVTPLPTIGDQPDIRRSYRLVETKIGNETVTLGVDGVTGFAGGFDVSYT
jgi:hypothetical protein